MADIDIVRRETIRPSSPTPDRLRKFGLSVFDQFQPDSYIPVVFFYHDGGESSVSGRIRRLKLSLSETLVRFYPVAGRVVRDELYVDCDDGGVDFAEARVSGCGGLSDILVRPDYEVLRKLLPSCPAQGGAHPLLRVQANVFECGGLAIGALFGHVVMDACAMSAFLRCWAAVARGDAGVPAPDLDAVASRFPAIPTTIAALTRRKACECSMRRFVFKADKIDALRDKATREGAERPSRVAVVSALIWKCIINALRKKSGQDTIPSVVSQRTNLRRRVEPPLSENSLGNMVLLIFSESDDCEDLQGLADRLRQGLRDLSRNDVTKLKGSEEAMTMICDRFKKYATLSAREDIDSYAYTSWCGFGWYEVDFGWGRPTWFSAVYSNVKNSMIMTDSEDGDGIEVLMTLPEQEMSFFESDLELLEFALLNPSVNS